MDVWKVQVWKFVYPETWKSRNPEVGNLKICKPRNSRSKTSQPSWARSLSRWRLAFMCVYALYVFMYTCRYRSMYPCTYVFTCTCIHVYMYTHSYVSYVCIYVYVCIDLTLFFPVRLAQIFDIRHRNTTMSEAILELCLALARF